MSSLLRLHDDAHIDPRSLRILHVRLCVAAVLVATFLARSLHHLCNQIIRQSMSSSSSSSHPIPTLMSSASSTFSSSSFSSSSSSSSGSVSSAGTVSQPEVSIIAVIGTVLIVTLCFVSLAMYVASKRRSGTLRRDGLTVHDDEVVLSRRQHAYLAAVLRESAMAGRRSFELRVRRAEQIYDAALAASSSSCIGANDADIARLPQHIWGEKEGEESKRSGQEQEEDDERCSICLDTYVVAVSRVTTLHCHHLFHSECITRWLRERHRCPLCLTPLTSTQADEGATVVEEEEVKPVPVAVAVAAQREVRFELTIIDEAVGEEDEEEMKQPP